MEDDERAIVHRALITLVRVSPHWGSNLRTYEYMTNECKDKWWANIQKKVQLGLRSMQPLVLEVIKQKMIG